MFGQPRFLIWFTLATALVVGGLLVAATDKWWTLLIPVALHALVTTLVVTGIFKRLNQGDKPDPVTEAHLEQERNQPLV